jgi:hypothetical protein
VTITTSKKKRHALKRDGSPRAKKHRYDDKPSRDILPGLGARLYQARMELGLSTRQLAAMANTTHSKIVGAENERGYGGLSLRTFARLCVATGRDPAWYFGWTNDRVIRKPR